MILVGNVLTMADDADTVNSFVKMVSDNGVTIVIAAIILFFLFMVLRIVLKMFNNMIDRDNELIGNIVPKLDNLQMAIVELQRTTNEAIALHNASSNQKFANISSNTEDTLTGIHDMQQVLSHVNIQTELIGSELKHSLGGKSSTE